MAAKPAIDIMAAVETLEASRPANGPLASTGCVHYSYRPGRMHWLRKPSAALRTHSLHLVALSGKRRAECLTFLDALLGDSTMAAECPALKSRLAEEFKFDPEAHTDGRTTSVERVLRSAHKSQIKIHQTAVDHEQS